MTIINKKGFTFLMKNFAGHTLKRDFIGKKKKKFLRKCLTNVIRCDSLG